VTLRAAINLERDQMIWTVAAKKRVTAPVLDTDAEVLKMAWPLAPAMPGGKEGRQESGD